MENWINAKVIATGEIKRVYQGEAGGRVFLDESNEVYKIEDLDFTSIEQPKIEESPLGTLSTLMTNMQNQEKMRVNTAEIEYWRKLRGDIFFQLQATFSQDMNRVLNKTNEIVDALFEQHRQFTKKIK